MAVSGPHISGPISIMKLDFEENIRHPNVESKQRLLSSYRKSYFLMQKCSDYVEEMHLRVEDVDFNLKRLMSLDMSKQLCPEMEVVACDGKRKVRSISCTEYQIYTGLTLQNMDSFWVFLDEIFEHLQKLVREFGLKLENLEDALNSPNDFGDFSFELEICDLRKTMVCCNQLLQILFEKNNMLLAMIGWYLRDVSLM